MSADAWDDDDRDELRPRPEIDIGENIHVLRSAAAKSGGRKKAWFLILVPVAVLAAGAADIAFNMPAEAWYPGIPPVPAFIFFCGFLASFLIALPGLIKIGREQATQELMIGDLGMEIVQTIVPDQPKVTTWSLLWKDLASVKLHRGMQTSYNGLVLTSRSGDIQYLRLSDWASAEGQSPAPASMASALISDMKDSRSNTLEHAQLVQALQQRGHTVDDDVPRPQDRLAAIIGLSLGIGAIVAALIFNYIVTR